MTQLSQISHDLRVQLREVPHVLVHVSRIPLVFLLGGSGKNLTRSDDQSLPSLQPFSI